MSSSVTYPLLPVIKRAQSLEIQPSAAGWGDRNVAGGGSGWMVPVMRSRVGLSFNAVLQPEGVRLASNNILMRSLTPDDYQHAYMRCPDVRSSVDSVVRVVSTADWSVVPTVDPSSPQHTAALDIAASAERFLKAPDKNGETWQSMTTAFLTNLLIMDAAVLEKVKNGRGDLAEIVARPGETFIPEVDKHGSIIRWYQDFGARLVPTPTLTTTDVPTFEPDDLLYMRLFANTRHPVYGTPILESLIEEVISIMRAAQNVMSTFDVDEIPPGILILAGIDPKAGKSALNDLRTKKGRDHVLRVLTTNPQSKVQPQWLQFKRSLKEVDMAGLTKEIKRTIWRTFGVMPIVQGDTEAMPRATAETQLDASDSHLVVPIKEQYGALMNTRIMPSVVGDPEKAALVRFEWKSERDLSTKEEEERGRTLTGYVKEGVLTRNEARRRLGEPPIEGGDTPTVTSGGRLLPLTEALKSDTDPDPDDGTDPDDGGVSDADGDADSPDADDEAPGEAEASAHPIGEPVAPQPSRSATESRASEEQVRRWLVEHYSGSRRLSRDRIQAMQRSREDGLLLRLLQPTGHTFAHRGLQVKRPTLARLLGTAGGVASLRSGSLDLDLRHLEIDPEMDPDFLPASGSVVLSRDGSEGRSLSSTSADRDKWWSLSPMRAAEYARGEVRHHMGEAEADRWYAVVITAQLDDQRYLLNPSNLAVEPGIGDVEREESGEALKAIILEEMEVITLASTTPLRLVYARGDSLSDLSDLLST